MTTVIRAEKLGRWYGQVVGLNDLTVEIGAGITGLIGPNGAGKSTFMKLVVGELRPSRGSVEVLGENPFANGKLYPRMGFCPQQDALYEHLSGRDFVSYLLRLTGVPRGQARELAEEALMRVSLEVDMHRKVSGYSKGMRQRVRIAQSIAHHPELIIADEPLTGLDPVARRQIIDLFLELAEGGTHIIVSSHVLHEVESLTANIVLIHRGRLLAQGSVTEIRRLLSRHPSRVTLRAREPRRLARALLSMDHIDTVKLAPGSEELAIETRNLDAFLKDLPRFAANERAGLKSLSSADASLEAVFDYLVG